MALFKKKTEEKEEIKEEKKTPPVKREKKPKVIIARKSDASMAYRFLLEPWITEKSHDAMANNKYVFRIDPNSNKKQIKGAIEGLYNVAVTKVTTVSVPRKKRIYGRGKGWKAGYKKAIVTLREGDKIELFKGV